MHRLSLFCFIVVVSIVDFFPFTLRDILHALEINPLAVVASAKFHKQEHYNNKNNNWTSQVLITYLLCYWILFAVWMSVIAKYDVPLNRYNVKNSKHLRYLLKRNSTTFSSQSELVRKLTKNKYKNELTHFLSFNSRVTQKCWVYPSSLERYFNELDTSNSISPELMKYEWARYSTFKTFPMESPVMPIRLASNGFYFNGSRDVVTCFSCGLVHGGWKDGDSVSDIHALLSPRCQYLRGTDETNVGIHGYDVHGATGGGTCETDSGCRSGEVLVQRQSGNFSDNDASSSSRRRNKFPKYESYQRRIDTYSNWPCTETIEPRVLAEAGYFYAGLSDCVRCFSCGGGLRNWEYGDGPWEEHARWFHWCSFLNEQKGPEFIQRHRNVQTDSDDEVMPGSTSIVSGIEALNALKGKPKDTDRLPNAINDKNDPTDTTGEMKQMVEKLREMGFVESDIKESLKRTGTTEIKETSLSNLLDDLVTNSAPADQSRTPESTNDMSMPETTHGTADYSSRTSNKTETINADSFTKMDPKILEEKNSRLKDQLNCKICMDKDSSVVFIPCGHMVSCETCAPNIRKCAICRQPIKGRVKAFMS